VKHKVVPLGYDEFVLRLDLRAPSTVSTLVKVSIVLFTRSWSE
jgi:hypothetical protein